MEGLVFILILIFVAVSSKNEKKKKAQSRAAGLQDRLTAELANRPNQRARRTPAPIPAVELYNDPPTVPVETPEPVFDAFIEAKGEGDSVEDDEECLGGSMGHDHTEGESVAEHRRHVEALLQREAEEAQTAQAALDFASMNVYRLRQAVVMAEILDRPKALRRRAG